MLLAVGSYFARYPMGPHDVVVGTPFFYVIWENGEDFEGPLMILAIFGNAVFAFLLPQFIFAVVRSTREQKKIMS